MSSLAKVFVIDDELAVRDSMRALITTMGFEVECFQTAEQFLEFVTAEHRGCIIADIRLSGMSGVELQGELTARGIVLPVIVISAYATTALTVQVMKQGALTLLEKPVKDQELREAIEKAVAMDQSTYSERSRVAQVNERLNTLSPSERRVLGMVVGGKPNKMIAQELGVSLRTVESRRHNVFKKMQTDTLADLVKTVVETENATVN